jgi:hypothetical protein
VNGAIAHLKKIDVPRDDARIAAIARSELDAVLLLERGNVVFRQPDWDLDRNGHAIIREHEPLQHLVA